MKHLKVLSLYGFVVGFNALVSFATFSLLTHHLTKADYGIINLYSSFVALVTPFIAVGVQYVVGIDYFKLSTDHFRKQITNALVIPVAATLALTLLFFLVREPIQNLLQVSSFFILTLPLACFLTLVADIMVTLFRHKGQHGWFAGFSISKNGLEAGLTLLLVVGMGYGWSGRLGSSLLALSGAGIFIGFLVHKWGLFTGHFEKGKISSIVKSGMPFIPERLAIFVLMGSDRFFIEHFSGLEQVGLYGAGAQLALVVNLAISTLSSTFHPVVYRGMSDGEEGYVQAKKATLAYTGVSALIALGVVVSIPLFFRYLIGPQFQEGQLYAVYLSIGMFFWAVYNAFLPYLLVARKNRVVMAISITGMAISLLANWFNVARFGAIGATYTSILVYLSMAGMVIWQVHRQYDLRVLFRYRSVVKPG